MYCYTLSHQHQQRSPPTTCVSQQGGPTTVTIQSPSTMEYRQEPGSESNNRSTINPSSVLQRTLHPSRRSWMNHPLLEEPPRRPHLFPSLAHTTYTYSFPKQPSTGRLSDIMTSMNIPNSCAATAPTTPPTANPAAPIANIFFLSLFSFSCGSS